MSYLTRLKQLESRENLNESSQVKLPKLPKPPFGSFGSTNPAYKNQNFSSNSVFTLEQEAAIAAWLTHIGEPEEEQYIVLNKCRHDPKALAYYLKRAAEFNPEILRQKVLNILAENPNKQRVYVIDTTADFDHVMLTFATRGVANFDMQIPTIKYDPTLMLDMNENESLQ